MKLRRLRSGRIKDMDSGLFVNKKLAKSFADGKRIPLLKANKKKSHKSKKINYPNKRAINVVKIRQYKDGFDIDFGHRGMDQKEMLYVGYYLMQMAERKINKDMNKDTDYWK